MKTFYAILLTFIFALAGCNGNKVNLSSLKPAATRTVGKLTIVLLNTRLRQPAKQGSIK